MAKPTSRSAGQLLGGILVGVLGLIAWAVRRGQSLPAEPVPPAAPSQSATPSGGQTPDTPRTTAPPAVRTLISAAVSIGMAGAVALALALAGVEDWGLRLVVAGGVLLLAACVFLFPRLLAPPRAPADLADVQELSPKDRIQFADDRRKLQNDVRSALLQAIVGGAVLVGVLFTWQQQQATSRQVADQLTVARQGQVGERFSRAVDQLGNESIDVRLGGLYELEQLAKQTPERRLVIVEVVAAFIREHAHSLATTTGPQSDAALSTQDVPAPPQDLTAALTILGRRPTHDGDPLLDLSKVKLGGFNLAFADLHGADLSFADLHRAYLGGANLRGAALPIANLRGANLEEADLRDAELGGADLPRGYLALADLTGAHLRSADLRNAHLRTADLRGAELYDADLRGAELGEADLRGAQLDGADLRGARADRWTQWPAGFDWRGAGVEQ